CAGLIDGKAGVQGILLDGRGDELATPPSALVHSGDDASKRESRWPDVAWRSMRDEGAKRGHGEVRGAHEDDANRCALSAHHVLLALWLLPSGRVLSQRTPWCCSPWWLGERALAAPRAVRQHTDAWTSSSRHPAALARRLPAHALQR